jgi:hypothetical protein
MRIHNLYLFGTALILGCALIGADAQTSPPPGGLVLPPADGPRGRHFLTALVTTNKEGDFTLPYVWAGVEQVTARTGWYVRLEEVARQTNAWLEFDKFTVRRIPPTPEALLHGRVISKEGQAYGAAYRASLPTDADLLRVQDVLTFSNLFGWIPFADPSTAVAGSVSVRWFTLQANDSIETLYVIFQRRGQSGVFDSILVRRARLQPQARRK